MILFFDTSALIKRYIVEPGGKKVDELFDIASQIIVSPITKIETHSALKRLLEERNIAKVDYLNLIKEINHDFEFFTILPFSQEIEANAVTLIEKYPLKTLDSIQLASCISKKEIIDSMVVADLKLKKAVDAENITTIDPTKFE